ncbi:MAG: hypothetical protein KUG78_00365 [Kangiellaceae bacterium]|nr:hypothetical protein [Kangiellaceae bacterium]
MKLIIFVLISTFLFQGCSNLLVSKEETYEAENKECLANGGDYIKSGSGIFDYECVFEVIPLSSTEEEGDHKAMLKECHAKGGQYVKSTNDEFGFDCLDKNVPKKMPPNK